MEKFYITKLDLTKTLRSLGVGETVQFTIAGEGREATYASLHSTRRDLGDLGKALKIVTHNNGLTATVTRTH